jgi:hypothetical protein
MKPVVLFVLAGLVVFGIVATAAYTIDRTSPGVDAARARQAAAEATEAEARANLTARQAAIDAAEYPRRAGAVTVAVVLAVVGVGVGGCIALAGIGIAAARTANLRAQLIHAQTSTGLYPAIMLQHQPVTVNEAGAQRLAALGARQRITAPAAGRLIESPGQPQIAALPAPTEADDLPERAPLDMWRPGNDLVLPCGITHHGRVVQIPIGRADTSLILVSGLPNSGKSTLLHAWESAIRRQSPDGTRAQLAVIDGKRVEFGNTQGGHLWAPVATMPEDISRLVHRVRVELDQRLDIMTRHRVTKITDLPSGMLGVLILMIDELAALPPDDRSIVPNLTHIARLGRAAGIVTIGATQRVSARVLTPELRALSDHAVGFRCRSQAESRLALCDYEGAELLPPVPGRGIHKHADLVTFQGFYDAQPVQPGHYAVVSGVTTGAQPVQPVATEAAQPPAGIPRLAPGDAIPVDLADIIRQRHQAGESMNRLSFAIFGHKSGSTLAALRDVIGGRG